jgi:hypothetical protein
MAQNIQFVNNNKGDVIAVQIPIEYWKQMQREISIYKRQLNIKKDLIRAFKEVDLMQKGKLPKQSLSDFLNEL